MKRVLQLCPILLLLTIAGFSQSISSKWPGTYQASAYNKDHLLTSFKLIITSNGKCSLSYSADGEAAQQYQNIKTKTLGANKLEIYFDPKNAELGTLYLSLENGKYYLSGQPVYFINPGNEQLPAIKSKK